MSPKVVVGLGEKAYRTLTTAFGITVGHFRSGVEFKEGRVLSTGSRAFALYHCGARIQNTHRRLEQQRRDWARIRPYLRTAPSRV